MPEQMYACPEWFGIPRNGRLVRKEILPADFSSLSD